MQVLVHWTQPGDLDWGGLHNNEADWSAYRLVVARCSAECSNITVVSACMSDEASPEKGTQDVMQSLLQCHLVHGCADPA